MLTTKSLSSEVPLSVEKTQVDLDVHQEERRSSVPESLDPLSCSVTSWNYNPTEPTQKDG
jgi:hypothetical protein